MIRVDCFDQIKDCLIPSKGRISNCYWTPDEADKLIRQGNVYLIDASGGYAWILKSEVRNQFYFKTDYDTAPIFHCNLISDLPYVAEVLFLTPASDKRDPERKVLVNCGFVLQDHAQMMIHKSSCTETKDGTRIIRPANKDRQEAIRELYGDSFDVLTDCIPSDRVLEGYIDSKSIWISEDPTTEELVGCALFEKTGRNIWIRHVAVKKERRRQGIAKDLLESVIAKNPEVNYSLWVKKNNNAAISLYENMGFSATNRQMEIWTKTKG